MAGPNKNGKAELIKIKTKDDQLKEQKYETEKHDHEKSSKSLKRDIEFYEKKNKSLNKKKVLLFITESS